MSKCSQCAWNNLSEDLQYCRDQEDPETCIFFLLHTEHVAINLKAATKEKIICSTCNQDKDPGKCWWCGN